MELDYLSELHDCVMTLGTNEASENQCVYLFFKVTFKWNKSEFNEGEGPETQFNTSGLSTCKYFDLLESKQINFWFCNNYRKNGPYLTSETLNSNISMTQFLSFISSNRW